MTDRDKFKRRAMIVRANQARQESKSKRSRAAILRWKRWREERGLEGQPGRSADLPRVLEHVGHPDDDINQLPDSLLKD